MLDKVSIAVKTIGVCDFSRLAVKDWRLWFLALMTATLCKLLPTKPAVAAVDAALNVKNVCYPTTIIFRNGGCRSVGHWRHRK